MKKKIVLVECWSTGANYVEDILKRGYEPVIVEASDYIGTEADVALFRQIRDFTQKKLPPDVKIIRENPDYNEILRQVREIQPLHIIAGSEFGVGLTVRLAHDLGLPGNPIERLSAMTQKDAMHEALKAHGLRYIRGKIVNSVQEAADFYDEIGAEGIVVKRTRGAATQGLHLCDNREDMLKAVETELKKHVSISTEKSDVLLQERINGREFIVNTVSLNGEHRLVSIWEYDKVKMPNGTNAYNYAETVNELTIGHSRLIRYAFEVADAIGIKYGPVHGEYMIDEKGPVLIEVNCRPMGGSMPRQFVDMAFGQHETDSALEAYLDPEGFALKKQQLYRPLRKAALKFFILPDDTPADTAPILSISRQLKSYYQGSFDRVGRETVLAKTRDVETAGGVVYMIHDNDKVVKRELKLLHTLEMKYPRILFHNLQPEGQKSEENFDLPKIMDMAACHGATLVFSDNLTQAEGVTVVNTDDLQDVYDGFDQGILDLQEDTSFKDLESLLQQIFTFFRKVRQGGRIIVPETTYRRLPYGMDGMDILAKLGSLRIEVPPSGKSSLLVATVL